LINTPKVSKLHAPSFAQNGVVWQVDKTHARTQSTLTDVKIHPVSNFGKFTGRRIKVKDAKGKSHVVR